MKTKKTEIIYIIHTLLQIVKKEENQRAGWGLAKSINELGSLWVSKMRVVSQASAKKQRKKSASILNMSAITDDMDGFCKIDRDESKAYRRRPTSALSSPQPTVKMWGLKSSNANRLNWALDT